MNTQTLIQHLLEPVAYPHPTGPIAVHHTHISVVFLAGSFAYKIKKAVRLGFLDFSTPELRKHFCEKEVELNRRLAPHVYLGVVPITLRDGKAHIGGSGEPIDWAVQMIRLPEEASFLFQLQQGTLTSASVDRLGRYLAHFHRTAPVATTIAPSDWFATVAQNVRENFTQAEPHIGLTVTRVVLERLRTLSEVALMRLQSRIEARPFRDTHGDLHLDHVYHMPGEPPPGDLYVIDCIEFNDRFRYADPVADVAFLIMDFKFRLRPDLAAVLANAYFAASEDPEGRDLLPFYTAYRAVVRGKVEGFELGESEVPEDEKIAVRERALGHWLLALSELEVPTRRPALVLVCGLPGTGKSTLAREVAAAGGFEVIRSDSVRKELAGVTINTHLGDECYTPDWTRLTYTECARRARELLLGGGRVIIDATLCQDRWRNHFFTLAQTLRVPTILFTCRASPDVVRRRLANRIGDASDATWNVYESLSTNWEPISPPIAALTFPVQTDPGTDPTAEAIGILRRHELLD